MSQKGLTLTSKPASKQALNVSLTLDQSGVALMAFLAS